MRGVGHALGPGATGGAGASVDDVRVGRGTGRLGLIGWGEERGGGIDPGHAIDDRDACSASVDQRGAPRRRGGARFGGVPGGGNQTGTMPGQTTTDPNTGQTITTPDIPQIGAPTGYDTVLSSPSTDPVTGTPYDPFSDPTNPASGDFWGGSVFDTSGTGP